MNRLSIRWLLLGVAAASLLLPLLGFLLLRLLDPHLVQQTERQLNAEAALVAEFYRGLWGETTRQPLGDPRPPARRAHPYAPAGTPLRRLKELAAPIPRELPMRREPSPMASGGDELSERLRSAQIFNLSGIRVLDSEGCVVASSRGQIGQCLTVLAEVRKALQGTHTTVIRARNSDEPAPPLGSLRRRGDLRVFVAQPVFNDGQLIGAIWLSRTAESGLEFLVKQRRGLFYGSLLLMASVLSLSALFAGLIIRPLQRMARAAAALSRGESRPPLSSIPAPKEVHALGAAFDVLTARLQERARYVSEFAAHVSHELKTPLTSIRGALELLLDSGATMEEDQRRRFLNNMDAAAARTERLVERLLLLARFENPGERPATEVVLVGEWVERNRSRWGETVQFDGTAEGRALVRPGLELDAVLGNLIDNALRYRRVAPVRVHVAAEAEWLHLTVSDDGPGISESNQTRLFVRFFTTERDRGGTGLGLAIVKAIAEGHHGRAEVQSGPEGTTVGVRM